VFGCLQVRLNESQSKNKLYFGNLPRSYTQKQLEDELKSVCKGVAGAHACTGGRMLVCAVACAVPLAGLHCRVLVACTSSLGQLCWQVSGVLCC
jgi:hypothetical protein